jgi:Glycosyl transferase family 2
LSFSSREEWFFTGAQDRSGGCDSSLTLNGERFLAEQLASLERQTFNNWKLIASDDGSFDGTRSILRAFQKCFEPGRVEIIDGPRRGVAANFLFQACAENLVSEYYRLPRSG